MIEKAVSKNSYIHIKKREQFKCVTFYTCDNTHIFITSHIEIIISFENKFLLSDLKQLQLFFEKISKFWNGFSLGFSLNR